MHTNNIPLEGLVLIQSYIHYDLQTTGERGDSLFHKLTSSGYPLIIQSVCSTEILITDSRKITTRRNNLVKNKTYTTKINQN